MTHDEAEALRQDSRHWTLGVMYRCPADPRVIVRNRIGFGWTWNFGHRAALPTIVAAIVLLLGPAFFLVVQTEVDNGTIAAVFALCLLIIVLTAGHIARGPH